MWGGTREKWGGTSKNFRPALCAGIMPPHLQIASDATASATSESWRFSCRATVVKVRMTYWVAAVKKTIQPCTAQPSASVKVTKQVEITIVNGLLVLLLLVVMKLAVSRD